MWDHGALAVNVWGFVLETLFYGLYLLLFALSWYVHRCYARSRSEGGSYRAGKFMVALSFLLFALITTNWILGFFRFYQAFVVQGEVPGGTTVYLESLTDPAWVAQASVYALSRLLMDMLLVARLYIIWNSKLWIVVLPTAMVLGDFIASIMICYYAAQLDGIEPSAFVEQGKWITASYSFSCCTNLVASSLIVYRVIASNRAMKEFNLRTSLVPIMLVIVESASIYTLFSVLLLVLFRTRSPGIVVALFFLNPLTGIVYSLITIQVALGLNVLGHRSDMTTPTLRRASMLRVRTPAADAPPVALPLDTLKYAVSSSGSRSELALATKPGQGGADPEG